MECECGCGQVTKIAPHTAKSRGWVKGQHLRYVNGHAPSPYERGFREAVRDVREWIEVEARMYDQGSPQYELLVELAQNISEGCPWNERGH